MEKEPDFDFELDSESKSNPESSGKKVLENEPEFEFDFDTDSPELTEEIVLAMLAPLSAKEAYTWGEKNPAYRKIVGQSLSNDLSEYAFVLMKFLQLNT